MNHMHLSFKSISENESFARFVVSAFIAPLDPTLDEVNEIKTVVSEAVTNAIIHGYEQSDQFDIYLSCELNGDRLRIVIEDFGVGIKDLDLAKEVLYTSKPEMERSGMGFTIMENLMDRLQVESAYGEGTKVTLEKTLHTSRSYCQ
ncbi:stage II sporulation protein AB (anti-sigma F factor) [Pelagirhabdus alkalitolerans]|uniref:Anti-sigma F factor n=1 Tax=Pelagirhabdus alkalitolerans TaxID=1612202 RepID=A0A1G6HC15_9BACI|nr:anti-sigma F factor [Pelagirhabdus alkalitolerans]SDB91741.1 stage II sporulation protein AB (anti-sigma F factor) [Pelagirhabdus alkalitolerans]